MGQLLTLDHQETDQQLDSSFSAARFRHPALNLFPPNETVVLACIDYREYGREGFLITSAGNIPHQHVLDDLHLILPGKKLLVLRCHTDCAKSKAEVPKMVGELESDYAERVEEHTLRRLWRDAETLLQDYGVKAALRNGLQFLAGRFDVHSQETEYFFRRSKSLVRSALEE